MKTLILLSVVLPSLAFAPAPIPKPGKHTAKEDLKSLQGTWVLLSLRLGGKANKMPPKAQSLTATITNDRWAFSMLGKVAAGGYQMVIGSTGNSKTIDLLRPGRPMPTIRGIYVLEGDVLKLYYGRPGTNRPKAADATDPNVMLMTLRRQK